MKLTRMLLAALLLAGGLPAADASANSAVPAGKPAIFGDGVHDDSEGIQAALDCGKSEVYLPRRPNIT